MVKMPSGVSIRILAGLSMRDVYRKPNIGMFQVVEETYRSHGFEIDLERSLFVGDAAGRLALNGRRKDNSDTDLKFALNAGLRFLTPEVSDLSEPADGRNTSCPILDRSTLSHPRASAQLSSETLLPVSENAQCR